jgi:hypothetical protein
MAEWIVPKGKTQQDIDAEFTIDQAEQERQQAREFLATTQDDVLAVIEDYLHGLSITDSRLHYNERRAARGTISEVARER